MVRVIDESDVEMNVLSILQRLGYEIIGRDNEEYLPGGSSALRDNYREVIFAKRLTEALNRINTSIPTEAREEAVKQVLRSGSQKLISDNETFHRMLVEGIDVPVQTAEGERYEKVWLCDFDKPKNNDFLAINQFAVIGNNIKRRLDVILFVNGIPLLIIELKNLSDEDATIWTTLTSSRLTKNRFPRSSGITKSW